VGGVENSGVTAVDCALPTLSLAALSAARPAQGQGHATAKASFHRGAAGTQLDLASAKATLRGDFVDVAPPVALDPVAETLSVDVSGLKDGKYTLFFDAKDRKGRPAPPLRLVFWVEAERFEWRDATLYMAMTDRLKNGDPSNDVQKTQGVDVRADFHNGDLEGVRQVVASGALDQLGVRALWLTPFQTNPKSGYPSDDGESS
jgi:hypothetical protein